LLFVSFITSTFEFNSTTVARERRAAAQGAQLDPGDLRMEAAAKAAVGAGVMFSLPTSSAKAMMRWLRVPGARRGPWGGWQLP
jgi:hypothetical protein